MADDRIDGPSHRAMYDARMPETPPSDWTVPDDWRAETAGAAFYRAKLSWGSWRRPKPSWDHDHCAFCWAKFSEHIEGHLRRGYQTGDREQWVCAECCDIFRDAFAFHVLADRPNGDDGTGPPTGPPPTL